MRPFINGIQCTALLRNKMQCTNVAVVEKENDPEHKTSVCPIHFGIVLHPDEYSVKLPQSNDIDSELRDNSPAQTAENTVDNQVIHDEKIG